MSELYKAKRMRGGDTVNSMTISKGTCKRKRDCLFMEISEGEWVEIDPATLVQIEGKAVDRVRELEEFLKMIVDCDKTENEYRDDGSNAYYWRLGLIKLAKEKLTPKSEV